MLIESLIAIGVLVAIIPFHGWIEAVSLSKVSIKLANSTSPHEAQWQNANGFLFVGTYQWKYSTTLVTFSIWQHDSIPAYLRISIVPVTKQNRLVITDFITFFAHGGSLGTTNTPHDNVWPLPPGSYVQNFTKYPNNYDDLWQKHKDALAFLLENCSAKPKHDKPFQEAFVEDRRRQGNYIRNIFLYPLRMPYYLCARKFLRRNKTIQQQHDKRMIKLTNQLNH